MKIRSAQYMEKRLSFGYFLGLKYLYFCNIYNITDNLIALFGKKIFSNDCSDGVGECIGLNIWVQGIELG